MASFVRSSTKYSQTGVAIKGKGMKQAYLSKFPNHIIFDSKSEYTTYLNLLEMEKNKQIKNLKLQVPFELIPPNKWYNNIKNKTETVLKTRFIVDFTFERNGKLVALDNKGWTKKKDKKTGKEVWKVYVDDIYKLKKKLFLQLYPDIIFEEA